MMKTLSCRQIRLVLLTIGSLCGNAWPVCNAQEPQTITFQQLVSYVELEVKEEKLLKMLADSPTSFSLGEDQIRKLQSAGASEKILASIRRPATAMIENASDIRDFVIVLDASASMRDETEQGISKWDSAKKAASDLIRAVPNERRLAFVVYGHDLSKRCNAIETIRALAPIDDVSKETLVHKIDTISPAADTPIGASLSLVNSMLASSNQLAKVILITDGMESCKGDPVVEAGKLAAMAHLQGGVDVIGFGLKPAEVAQVERIAKSGHGKFYNAENVSKLRESVAEVQRTITKSMVPESAPGTLSALDRLLIKNLSDEDVQVRGTAAATIHARGLRAAISDLATLVSNERWERLGTINGTYYIRVDGSKAIALDALLAMDSSSAHKALLSAYKSKNSEISLWAHAWLDKLPVSGAADAFSETILNQEWDKLNSGDEVYWSKSDARKEMAVASLKKLAPQKIEELLLKAAESKEAEIRTWAIKKLAELEAAPN